MTNKNERLFSLDVLRGLDMMLLTLGWMMVSRIQKGYNCFSDGFILQFKHGWECFHLWDIIMPLFIFMCGAAMPFALEKRLNEGKWVFWKHVLFRVVFLWFLGGLIQGEWASLDPLKMQPFSNTLQSIAIGYLIVAATMTCRRAWLMIAVPIVLAAVYTIALAVYGVYEPENNLATKIDAAILSVLLPSGHPLIGKCCIYTWWFTSTMFAVMTFAGYHATKILRNPVWSEWRKAIYLLVGAVALLVIGYGLTPWIPCIKPIYTFTCTSIAMGWSVLGLAILYIITDIFKLRFGLGIVILYGQCALASYVLSHIFRDALWAAVKRLGYGMTSYLPEAAVPAFDGIVFAILITTILYFWRRQRDVAKGVK